MQDELADDLRGEESTPELPTADSAAPFVLQEGDLRSRSYVTVIWSRWEGVAKARRGRIILEAYRDAGQSPDNIGLALGLTYGEADNLGLIQRLREDR